MLTKKGGEAGGGKKKDGISGVGRNGMMILARPRTFYFLLTSAAK
jgi:hypothetical protein